MKIAATYTMCITVIALLVYSMVNSDDYLIWSAERDFSRLEVGSSKKFEVQAALEENEYKFEEFSEDLGWPYFPSEKNGYTCVPISSTFDRECKHSAVIQSGKGNVGFLDMTDPVIVVYWGFDSNDTLMEFSIQIVRTFL